MAIDTTSGGVPEYVTSTSDQKAYGLDLEARWQPVTPLTFGLTAAYINSTYKKFVSQYGFDLAGQPTGEPNWSFSASADYSVSLDAGGGLDFFVVHSYRGAVRCNDESLATKACLPQAPFPLGVAQNVTDARIGWHSASRKWGLALYGNSVFDKRYVTGVGGLVAATFGTPTGSVNAPRRYGIDVHASF